MKKILTIIIILSFMLVGIKAETNFILNHENLTESQINSLNSKLKDLADTEDFYLYININKEDSIDFNTINSEDATMLLSINPNESSYSFTATPKASSLYNKKTQEKLIEEVKASLNTADYETVITKLITDIKTVINIEPSERLIFSPKRLLVSSIIGFLIALLMSQRQKNRLKTFRSRGTANTYLSDFEIISKKDIKTNEKTTTEYLDKQNNANIQKGSSGKF